MCCITFTLHVYDTTVKSGGGGDNGGVTGQKKPVTTVQCCVSIFAHLKLMDVFKENSRKFPAVLVMTKTVFLLRSWNILSSVCGEKH